MFRYFNDLLIWPVCVCVCVSDGQINEHTRTQFTHSILGKLGERHEIDANVNMNSIIIINLF